MGRPGEPTAGVRQQSGGESTAAEPGARGWPSRRCLSRDGRRGHLKAGDTARAKALGQVGARRVRGMEGDGGVEQSELGGRVVQGLSTWRTGSAGRRGAKSVGGRPPAVGGVGVCHPSVGGVRGSLRRGRCLRVQRLGHWVGVSFWGLRSGLCPVALGSGTEASVSEQPANSAGVSDELQLQEEGVLGGGLYSPPPIGGGPSCRPLLAFLSA